jgi:hypothetical protein
MVDPGDGAERVGKISRQTADIPSAFADALSPLGTSEVPQNANRSA